MNSSAALRSRTSDVNEFSMFQDGSPTLPSPHVASTSTHYRDGLATRESELKVALKASPDDTFATRPQPSPTVRMFVRSESGEQLIAVQRELLAEWNGCVTSLEESAGYFLATLTGVSGEGVKGEEEDAQIPLSDVSEGDLELLRPGNFFRLCVVREVSASGQPKRYTQVVFRRLPAYRRADLEAAQARGRDLARGLRVD